MADDDAVLPGMAPEGEDDDDLREDAAALFGVDLGASQAPIDLEGNGGEGTTTAGTGSNTNSSAPSVSGNATRVGKRKSPVWADFDEIYEDVNGSRICTKAVCKMCKATLSARSVSRTGHLKRHQKSCKEKTNRRAAVQSRLALNPNGLRNWDYKT
jgi:hypothetical protein